MDWFCGLQRARYFDARVVVPGMRTAQLSAAASDRQNNQGKAVTHARCVLRGGYHCVLRNLRRFRALLRQLLEGITTREILMFDYILTGAVSMFLLVYLFYALLNPEKF